MRRKVLLFILCLGLAGCITTSKGKKVEELEECVSTLQGSLLERDEIILKRDVVVRELQASLKESERQLDEKDAKILQLREKLEMFGVFEK
ncbi:MAG: hypothetical protein ISS47_08215 [Candidatus Omnitrophica bacterium]|nr:hypothetical protein [Candidatus Omnitrophota bacterium]